MASSIPPREVTLKPKAPPAVLLQAGRVVKLVVPSVGSQLTLFEDRISVRDVTLESEALPRRYTLTRNDRTADLILSVGPDFDHEALSQPSTRRMPDGVLAELTSGDPPQLTVRGRFEGPELAGKAADPGMWRRIIEKEMPFALAVIRYGDRFFFERHPELDQADVVVEFAAIDPRPQAIRHFGVIADYRVTRIAGESRRLVLGAAVAAVGIGVLIVGKLRNR